VKFADRAGGVGHKRRGDVILTRLYYRKQQCIAMLDSPNSPFSLTKTAHDDVESGYKQKNPISELLF
jgi:hypothetical protein